MVDLESSAALYETVSGCAVVKRMDYFGRVVPRAGASMIEFHQGPCRSDGAFLWRRLSTYAQCALACLSGIGERSSAGSSSRLRCGEKKVPVCRGRGLR